jgi:uncharacterized protein YeaO (DUF488 family)
MELSRAQEFVVKRVYDESSPTDGHRVLIDGLWPRGVKKERVTFWVRYLAPSNELRKWFLADRQANWTRFREQFKLELGASDGVREFLVEVDGMPRVTLLYASSDPIRNHAVVLAEVLTDSQQ